ncbi:M-phase inducer phosphatase [Cytospora mali]|uniref:M-phase inducer phosphatase n=1 Tax=Cytospora mali TaxID=578113 RepID=A0A194VPE1_CYTMA|nr:M-phase inducer phosphatase [Valsa mali]
MEASSPLAAMYPPAAPSFGHPDMFRSNGHSAFNGEPRGSAALFRDRLKPKGRDYFTGKSVNGSSPTASLAADLSQNFRIDNEASPLFPTPRRALFTTNAIMGALERKEYQTTPPLPADSSPGYMDMDISPLPMGKGSYVAQIEVHSPTPIPSPDDDDDEEMSLDSPAPISRLSSVDVPKPLAENRRKLNLRRPSLTRSKGLSTSAMPTRSHPEIQFNSFKFGNDGRPRSPTSQLSLSECFQESPPQERRSQFANSPCVNIAGALRSKIHFPSLSGTATRNGSPIISHSRRGSNPHLRPRKQYRRSQSMFESTGDVIKPKKDPNVPVTLQSVKDVEEPAELVLPHFFPEEQNDSIPRVSRSTFLEILDGKYNQHYKHKLIIDCRFEYEYEGGHVDGAINYNDKELLASHLFQSPLEGRTLLLFHCEYSVHRAPLMARHIRSQDRSVNAECYPKLTYPEVYILEGGYSGFFSEHRLRCYPQSYVGMDAAEHANTCEKEMDRLRQPRKGLGRAQTYAFGQRENSFPHSPTASQRSSCDDSPMQLGDSPSLGYDRNLAKRMASY